MTYLQLAIVVVLLAAVVAILARLGCRWWAATALTGAVLTVLTIVFDSLMIHLDLFRFDQAHLAGIYVLLAPLEDLAWPVVAALMLPAVWALLGRRRGRASGQPAGEGVRQTQGRPGPREEA